MITQFQKKPRNSNLELYRIIVMLLIVAHHYVVNSGLMPELEKAPLSAKSIYFYLFGMWGKTGINCFVLITGYFMCKSHITIRKFLKLLLQIEFYAIAINAIFALTGYHHFGVKDALMAVWSIPSIADGFVSCFLAFYLFIPFLNVLTSHLDKKTWIFGAFMPFHIYVDGDDSLLPSYDELCIVVLCVVFHSIIYTSLWLLAKVEYRKMGGYHLPDGNSLDSKRFVYGIQAKSGIATMGL